MAKRKTDRKRILVCDDTQEILELFEEVLGEMGHEVILMSFAPRELERIKEVDPDLMIIDFVLGGREYQAWQLLQKMKMDRATARIPVIICTGAVREVREQEGYLTKKGVTIVLKPFDLDDLEQAVESALRIAAVASDNQD